MGGGKGSQSETPQAAQAAWGFRGATKHPMNPQALPAPIEAQLAELESRHKRHQRMLYDHHEAKHNRRDQHRKRHSARKPIPITLI